MEFCEAYQMFLEYVEARGHSPLTVSSYRQDQRSFQTFLWEKTIDPHLDNLDAKIVRRYIVWMKGKGYSRATMKRKIDSLSSFYNYTEFEELIQSNPLKKVDRIKKPKLLPRFLSDDEVHRLIYAVDHYKALNRLGNKAMIRILLYCGLRRSELFNLDWSDIDFCRGTILVRLGKGEKDRVLPMNTQVNQCLWDYLQSRLPLTCPAVFTNHYGNRMKPNNLMRLLRKLAMKAGIQKALTAHLMRHTFATMVLKKTDIVTLQKMLGHCDLSTTQIYAHTSTERMAQAVENLLI